VRVRKACCGSPPNLKNSFCKHSCAKTYVACLDSLLAYQDKLQTAEEVFRSMERIQKKTLHAHSMVGVLVIASHPRKLSIPCCQTLSLKHASCFLVCNLCIPWANNFHEKCNRKLMFNCTWLCQAGGAGGCVWAREQALARARKRTEQHLVHSPPNRARSDL